MKFEIGKFYRNTSTRTEMAVVGAVNTTLHGCTGIAEVAEVNNKHGLEPIAVDSDDATINWIEITEDKWLKNFTK